MAQEPSTENATSWWKSLPGILTAAATFIGAVAALLALFVGPGDGGGEPSNGEAQGAASPAQQSTPPTTTPAEERVTITEEAPIPLKNESGDDVRDLLAMVPSSLQSRCMHAPDAGGGDELATISCEIGGATFYYYLFADELDAVDAFRVGVRNADGSYLGNEPSEHARSCAKADVDRPFVGSWTRGGGSGPAGQRLCVRGVADTLQIDWTETGRPIHGEMYYGGTWEEAELVWDRVVRG